MTEDILGVQGQQRYVKTIQTIRNRLRADNLRSRRPAVHTPLSQRHRRACRDWYHQPVQWARQQWSRVVFSDKSRFNLRFHDGRIRVFRRQGESFSDATVSEHDRYGDGSVMVCAGMTVILKTQFCIIDGNLSAQRYVNEILQPVVVPFLGKMHQGAIFQDDNARPHRNRVVNDFIRLKNIQGLEWPANSPDLNPIEHISGTSWEGEFGN